MRTVHVHYLPDKTLTALCGLVAPGFYVDMQSNLEDSVSTLPYDYDNPQDHYEACEKCIERKPLVDLKGATL